MSRRLPLTRRRPSLRRLAASAALAVASREVLARAREADLRGQAVFITGGSRGLGFLLAREFGREGCRVAICARDEGELEWARGRLESDGADVLALRCDVGDASEVDRAIAQATLAFGQVDILVNNAGIIQVGPLEEMVLGDFEEAQQVIFWGTVYPTLAVLPQMRARGSGRIVNVTSIGGRISAPHLLPYSAAKFAAVGFSEGLRSELRRDGILVTTIVPGFMRTGSYARATFLAPQEREFAWFAVGASLPLLSMSAERAAREIVTATKRGETERILGLPAQVAVRFHGLFPGLTTDLVSIGSRLLPRAAPGESSGGGARAGQDLEPRMSSRLFGGVTTLGRSAGERYGERGDGRSG